MIIVILKCFITSNQFHLYFSAFWVSPTLSEYDVIFYTSSRTNALKSLFGACFICHEALLTERGMFTESELFRELRQLQLPKHDLAFVSSIKAYRPELSHLEQGDKSLLLRDCASVEHGLSPSDQRLMVIHELPMWGRVLRSNHLDFLKRKFRKTKKDDRDEAEKLRSCWML